MRHLRGIYVLIPGVLVNTVPNARNEIVHAAVAVRLMGRMPSLEIESPHQHRKLCAQMDGFLDAKMVADSLKDEPQGQISAVAVLPSKFYHEFV